MSGLNLGLLCLGLPDAGRATAVRLFWDGLIVLVLVEALVLDVVVCRRIFHRTVN